MDIIDFLEKLGQDAQLRGATRVRLQAALLAAGMPAGTRQALMSGDEQALRALLDADENRCCLIASPRDEEDEEEEQTGNDEAPASPQGKAAGVPAPPLGVRSARHVAAAA